MKHEDEKLKCRIKGLEARIEELSSKNVTLSGRIRKLKADLQLIGDTLWLEKSAVAGLKRHFACPVCLEDDRAQLELLQCGHVLCTQCYWAHKKKAPEEDRTPSCPECRVDLAPRYVIQ